MKLNLSLMVLLLLLGACSATSRTVATESSQMLAGGFRLVSHAQPQEGGWEGITHFNCLYYQDRQLGRTNQYAISPSGRYALWQDGPSGKVRLFDRQTALVQDKIAVFVALVERFDWYEAQAEARVVFADETVVRISLIQA